MSTGSKIVSSAQHTFMITPTMNIDPPPRPPSPSLPWECANCLGDNSCDRKVCEYCDAPKRERKKKEKEENKPDEVAASIEKPRAINVGLEAGGMEVDNPIVLDGADEVIVIENDAGGGDGNGVIDLISDDESDLATKENPKKKIKLEFDPKKFGEADDPDGDVVEVKPPGDADIRVVGKNANVVDNELATSESNCTAIVSPNNGEDEVEVTGQTGLMSRDMPHSRHDCTVHPFSNGISSSYFAPIVFNDSKTSKNELFCPNCYCFVCDVPAKDCNFWRIPHQNQVSHCNANNYNNDGNGRWKKAREVMSDKFGRMLLEEHLENNSNHSESNELIPSSVTNFLNESKRVVSSLDQSFMSYKHGSYHVYAYESDNYFFDSEDSYGKGVCNRDFNKVVDSLLAELYRVDGYLGNQMKPKLIRGIIMLVEVTKRFINFDHDLRNGIDDKHNFDDQIKPKYDKGLQFIFLRWSNLILGKKLDSFVHIRNTVMSSLEDFGDKFLHIRTLAQNDWGDKDNFMSNFINKKCTDVTSRDIDEIQKMQWLQNESYEAKIARCEFFLHLVKKNRERKAIILKVAHTYAAFVEVFYYAARFMYDQTQSLEGMTTKVEPCWLTSLRLLLRAKKSDCIDVSKSLDLVPKICQSALIGIECPHEDTNYKLIMSESLRNDVSKVFAYAVINVFYLVRFYYRDTVKNMSHRDYVKFRSCLDYLYTYFVSVEGPHMNSRRSPNMSPSQKSDTEIVSWVKSILRDQGPNLDLVDDEFFYGVKVSESGSREPTRWLELVVGIFALLVCAPAENKNNFSPHWRLLWQGARFTRGNRSTTTINLCSPDFRHAADILSQVNILNYAEHSLEIPPEKVDDKVKDFVSRVRSKGAMPFQFLDSSVIQRIISGKSLLQKLPLCILNIASSMAMRSDMDDKLFLILKNNIGRNDVELHGYCFRDMIESSSSALERIFRSGNESAMVYISNIMTWYNECNPGCPTGLLFLVFTVPKQSSSIQFKEKAMDIEKLFITNSIKTLKREILTKTSNSTKHVTCFNILFNLKACLFLCDGSESFKERLDVDAISYSEAMVSQLKFVRRSSFLKCLGRDKHLVAKFLSYLENWQKSFIAAFDSLCGLSIIKEKNLIRGLQIVLEIHGLSKNYFEGLTSRSLHILQNISRLFSSLSANNSAILNFDKRKFMAEVTVNCVSFTSNHISGDISEILVKLTKMTSTALRINLSDFTSITQFLIFTLYTDIQVYMDKECKNYRNALVEICGQKGFRGLPFDMQIGLFRGVIEEVCASILHPKIPSLPNNVRDANLARILEFDEEVKIAPIFVSNGPLETSLKCLFESIRGFVMNTMYRVNFNGLNVFSNALALKFRNPVVFLWLKCLTGVHNNIGTKRRENIENFERLSLLNYSTSIVVNEEAKSCLDIYLKVQLTSGIESLTKTNRSEYLSPSLYALCAYMKQSCCYVWLPFVVRLWPLQLITNCYKPCVSIEDQNMAMFQTIHNLCALRRGSSADLVESAVVNLRRIGIGSKSEFGKMDELNARYDHLIRIVACSIRIDCNQLADDVYTEFEKLRRLVSDFLNEAKRIGISLGNSKSMIQLGILFQPSHAEYFNWWANVRQLGGNEDIKITNHIVCTNEHSRVIDALSSVNEEWTRKILTYVWLSFYQLDPISSLEYLKTKLALNHQWDRSTILCMIAVASSDMKFAEIFRKETSPSTELKSKAFVLAKIDENVRTKWENVVSYLLERTPSTSFQHRFISFCLKPTEESWKNVSAPKSVENTFFEALSSSEKPWDCGIHFADLIVYVSIATTFEKPNGLADKLMRKGAFSTDDGYVFGPINTFPSNEFNRKVLASTLRKNPSFTAYYQNYVISRCMNPNFKPWSMEKAMSFKEFISDVNSKMFLCISCICFLTKSVPAYQALAKIMEKAEYRMLAHEFQWEDINKKFLSSLFPSDDLNNDNLQLMIDSWIAIYEMNGNTCPDQLKSSILKSLNSNGSRINLAVEGTIKFESALRNFCKLLQKISDIDVTALKNIFIRMFYRMNNALNVICKSDVFKSLNKPFKIMILDAAVIGMINELDTTTVSTRKKEVVVHTLRIFGEIVEDLDNAAMRRWISEMKNKLRRKKHLVRHLKEHEHNLLC